MALDNADRSWLQGEFRDLHGRITNASEKQSAALHDFKLEMAAHVAAPCRDVLEHKEQDHNPAKLWGMLASIVAIAATVAGALMWFLNHGK